MIIILTALGFKKSSSKCLEICLIVFNSLLFFFMLLSFILIKWAYISSLNLIMFIFLFIIIIINIILSSFLRHWRNKDLIKTVKKDKGTTLAKTGLGITIVLLILTIIEEFIFGLSPIKRKDESEVGSLIIMICIAYFTFSFLEYFSIYGIILWCFLKERIINELDNPQTGNVVVVQPIYVNGQGNVPIIDPNYNVNGQGNVPIIYPNNNISPYNTPNMNVYVQSNNIQERLEPPNQNNIEANKIQETKRNIIDNKDL